MNLKRKKILLIAYYWPPYGGAGVFRIIRFTKFLHELGYEIAVLAPSKAFTHAIDENLVDQLPKDIVVRHSKIFEPTTFFNSGLKRSDTKLITDVMQSDKGGFKAKLSKWLRLNVFVPDAKIGWYPYAVREGKKLIKDFQPDVIFSTSPPPTVSVIAKKLASWSGIPWICDFRDPWTNIYYYDDNPRTAWANKRNKRLESQVLQQADHITLVSDGFFGDTDISAKSTIINNGFDPLELERGLTKTKDASKLTIRYLGTMKVNQFAPGFFEAVKELYEEIPGLKDELQIEFFGSTVKSTQEYIQAQGLSELIAIKEFVPRNEAIDLLLNTDILLIIIGKSQVERKMYTTKLFEYVGTGNAVIGMGPVNGVAADVLRHTKAGKMHSREDKPGVKETIKTYYERWKEGVPIEVPDKNAIDAYSFRTLTQKLSDIIQNI